MTVTDQRCDRCGNLLVGPAGLGERPEREATRFLYHPGDFKLRDDSGLLCGVCADRVRSELGKHVKARCASCGTDVEHARSLYVYIGGDDKPWQLCAPHAAAFLNTLRTVEEKLDPETFTLSGDWASARKEDG